MKVKNILVALVLLIISACNENSIEPVLYGNLTGIVFSPDGKSIITGASVSTNPPTSAIVTNDSGAFSIQNIPIGNYTVTASKNGYSKGTVSISVTNGETSQAILFLNNSSSSYIPGIPRNPLPSSQSINQLVSLKLTWSIKPSIYYSQDSTWFDVFLYESGSTIQNKIASNITDTSVSIINLKYNTTYFWQVIAKGKDTNKSCSEIWNFKTQSLPDNSIVFARQTNGNYQILSMNSSGENSICLTSSNNRNWWPKLNKRYNKIAFTSDAEVEPQIYTMNRDGSGIFKVTTISITGYNNNGTGFCWSPDGYFLYYAHYDKLYRINMDGSNLMLISTAPQNRNFKECDVSPTGNKIAAHTVGTNVYQSEIYLMDTDGNNSTQLVNSTNGKLEGPAFSIDGKKLLYCYDVSGFQNSAGRSLNSHIFSITLDGKDTVDLSINKISGTNDFNPSYSSDGSKIIFANAPNDNSTTPSIYIMNLDGSNRAKLMPDGTMPDWK